MRPYTIATLLEAQNPHDVNGERTGQPPRQGASIVQREIVAAGEHGHAGARRDGTLDHGVSKRSARVTAHSQIVVVQADRFERLLDEGDAAVQSRPCCDQRRVQTGCRWRDRGVHGNRGGRRVVEDEQYVREQPMTRCEVNDAAAPEPAPNAPRHLPAFVELLPWQAAGVTDRTREPIEESVA